MSDYFWLREAQFERIKPYFPLSHGVPRVDDRRVVSGIIHVIRNGLRWRDAPEVYGPHKTLYNRFARWSRMAVFARIFSNLIADDEQRDCLMIDSTHLKAHRTAASLQKGGGCSPAYRAHERRAELQAARCLRRDRSPDNLPSDRRSDERPQGRGDYLPEAADRRHADWRQGLRQRRFPGRTYEARHHALHPAPSQTSVARDLLQGLV